MASALLSEPLSQYSMMMCHSKDGTPDCMAVHTGILGICIGFNRHQAGETLPLLSMDLELGRQGPAPWVSQHCTLAESDLTDP